MHGRLFVLTDKKNAKTSDEARHFVYQYLCDHDFASPSRFHESPIDWFVIGGRWSGELTRLQMDRDKLAQFEVEFEKLYGWYINKDNDEKKRYAQAEPLFKKYFPDFKGIMPYWRDSYQIYGYEDDAQIVNEELFKILRTFINIDEDKEALLDSEGFVYLDKPNIELKKEEIVGKTWAVVIDFHY